MLKLQLCSRSFRSFGILYCRIYLHCYISAPELNFPSFLLLNLYLSQKIESMKRVITYFLQGLVLVAPIIITAYTIYIMFNFVDGLLRDYIKDWFGKNIPGLGAIFILYFR